MKTIAIAFLATKGGSGKTTLAVHTAVAAMEAGERVVILDTDPQGSAQRWSQARTIALAARTGPLNGPAQPPVLNADHAGLAKALASLGKPSSQDSSQGVTLAIVDTAPHAAPAAAQIARNVDLVIIPVRPTLFDLAATQRAVDIVKAAGTRAAFVLSACPFRAPEIAGARAALASYGLPICPIEIVDRRAYARAVLDGGAVTEFESDGKAAAEIRSLWAWLTGLKGELA